MVLSFGFSAVHSVAQAPADLNPSEQVGPPAHPATEAQVREYLSLTGVSKASHELMAKMVTGMRATSAPYLTASFWDDLNAEFVKLDVVSPMVTVYQRYLSEDDMRAVIAFYRSGEGKKMLLVQSMLTRDTEEALRKKGAEIGQAVYTRHKDEIDTAKKQYDESKAAPSKELK